jgi:CRISPR/Cas system CSM-associated protein Csm3 (group 7 of RAMP superfamily)
VARVLVKTVENRKKASTPYVPQSAVKGRRRTEEDNFIKRVIAEN